MFIFLPISGETGFCPLRERERQERGQGAERIAWSERYADAASPSDVPDVPEEE